MEAQFQLPETAAVETNELLALGVKGLQKALEKELLAYLPIQQDPVGVGLFVVDPTTCALVSSDPAKMHAENTAMRNAYRAFSGGLLSAAGEHCKALLQVAGVLGYLQRRASQLADYNVVVHLHYYRNREKPDQGFHKDTRGQTLFFLIQYLNEKPVYGAEWLRQRGELPAIQDGKYVIEKEGERYYLPETGLPEGYHQVKRFGPADVEYVWPLAIREDVLARRAQHEERDDDIHVLRVGSYGAVLVVDDIIHHRTPNPNSRDDWGTKRGTQHLQVSTLQANNALNESDHFEIARGRSPTREQHGKRGRSRSRSLSKERKKKEKEDPETLARWDATFNSGPRQFFRIWVTVSPAKDKVRY